MSYSRASSMSSIYSANTETSNNWDSEEDSSYSLNISDDFILDGPLPIEPSLLLTKDEKKLIDEFYKKMKEISEQDDQAYNQNENYIENALRNVDRLVSEYLEKGIRLSSYLDNTTITNLIFSTIEGIACNAMDNDNVKGGYLESTRYRYSSGDGINEEAPYLGDEILESDCINIIENIVINVLSKGGRTTLKTPFQYEGLCHIERSSEHNLSNKCRKINSQLKNIAYKSVINKNKRKDNFGVAIDNGYFYIKYEKGSIVELTKVTNNKIMEDLNSEYKLNLRVGILLIGSSVIRVERLGEKRNYTDVPQGVIKISFTMEIEGKKEKISIYLYPDTIDNNKIKVKLDEENQEKFNKLKDKSSLGKDCFLGGKSVIQAIQDKEFTKHESCKPTTPAITATFVEQASISNIFSSLRSKLSNLIK